MRVWCVKANAVGSPNGKCVIGLGRNPLGSDHDLRYYTAAGHSTHRNIEICILHSDPHSLSTKISCSAQK